MLMWNEGTKMEERERGNVSIFLGLLESAENIEEMLNSWYFFFTLPFVTLHLI